MFCVYRTTSLGLPNVALISPLTSRMVKRVSRKLWDDTRKSPRNYLAIFHAILYELQPLDFMHRREDRKNFLLLRFLSFTNTNINNNSLNDSFLAVRRWTLSTAWEFLRCRSRKEWLGFICLLGYWKLLVFLHHALDAGPSFLILTALVLIFTIGLGDESQQQGQEHLSAYSVFNRGFRNMMGGVDATALLQQHVGGGLVPPALGGGGGGAGGYDDDLQNDLNDPAVRQRQQRQHQRDQQRNLQQQRDRHLFLQQQQHQQQQEQDPNNDENQLHQGARKSNKKNRRKRNIELRREMQQQRDAAAAMGFAGGAGDNQGHLNIDLQQRDQVAMNRLVEDQILQQADD